MLRFTEAEAQRYYELRPLLVIELLLLWVVLPALLIVAAGQGYRAGVLEDAGLFSGCAVGEISTIDAVETFFTGRVGGCPVPDSANSWRGFFAVGLSLAVIAIVYATVSMLMFGPVTIGPVTAREAGEIILMTSLGLVLLAAIAVFVLIYIIVIAFAFMTGITILAAVAKKN